MCGGALLGLVYLFCGGTGRGFESIGEHVIANVIEHLANGF